MGLSSGIIQIKAKSSIDVCAALATRVKSRRLELNLTQSGLATRAGVNIETYRKFERTGEISLRNLVKLAFVFDLTTDFDVLFSQRNYQNLDELLGMENGVRKRGKKL